MTHENPVPDEDDEVYDLSVDEAEDDDAEAIMQEALAAVDSAKRPSSAGDQESAASEDQERGSSTAQMEMISELETEVAQLRERSLRTLADYENYRKRVERERVEHERYAGTESLREFLPVVDNLERALAAKGSVEDLTRGVEMILKQMQDLLKRFGAEPIAAAPGQTFDPMLHEAVTREEDPSVDRPIIVDELQRGYSRHERLLRPSMVRVAMPPEVPGDTDAQAVWTGDEERESDSVELGDPDAIDVSASDPEEER